MKKGERLIIAQKMACTIVYKELGRFQLSPADFCELLHNEACHFHWAHPFHEGLNGISVLQNCLGSPLNQRVKVFSVQA